MNGSRRFRLLLALGLIVVTLAGYGLYWMIWVQGTVWTDDAYVDARIVSVSSRLPGRIRDVVAVEGDRVKQGQVLARLGPKKLEALVKSKEAEVAESEAVLADLVRGPSAEEIAVGESQVRVKQVALEKKQLDHNRAEMLFKAKALSQAEFDRVRNEMAMARAELQVARNDLAFLKSGSRREAIARARATVERAKAQLEDAMVDMVDYEMKAPVDGIVARRTVDPGEVVDAGQGLFQLVENGRSWVVANLEEQDISELRAGQPVDVTLDAYPGLLFRGKVGPLYGATLSRFSLLSTSSASGNFIKVTQRVPVRIDWAEPYNLPLVPGLNATVRIHLNGDEEVPPASE